MPARRPTLGGTANPFGVSNPSFSAFDMGSGEDPIIKELREASEKRYEVGLRYNNGQATEAEYQAAIAVEMAIAQRMTGSSDPDVKRSAERNVAELTNLVHDVRNHALEVAANATSDHGEALLAVYQQELAGMLPGSTGYQDMQRRITDLQDSISNQVQADTSRQAAFELASVQNAWEAGTASDDEYKAAYAKYAAAQKPGTTEAVNAAGNLRDLTFRLDRNKLVQQVDEGSKSLDDLLAFDKAHLGGVVDKGSQGYRDALGAVQQTEKAVYDRDRSKIEDDVQQGRATPAQAIAFYKEAAGVYATNRDIVANAADRISSLNDAVQSQHDSDAISAFNKGTMSPTDFLAYAATRRAAYAVGTAQRAEWDSRIETAKVAAVQPGILASYDMSQQYISLQKFIADNGDQPKGGTKTTTRQVLQADGTYKTVTTTTATPPTEAEIAAWKQRQAEVADAKVQLAALGKRIAASPNGFVTSQQMLGYWQGELAKVAKGSPEWFTITDKINGTSDRIHAEALLTGGGVKIGYPGVTTAGLAASGGAGAPAAAGGGKAGAPAGGGKTAPQTVAPGTTFNKPATGRTTYGHTVEEFAGGRYTSDQLDYVANRVAAATGLDPRVVRLWVIKEQGHANNPLGVSQGGNDGQYGILSAFKTIDDGINEAITWINTHGNMRGIKNAAGKSVEEQISAIDHSPWGPGGGRGGYNGSLMQLAAQQGYKMPGPSGTVATPGTAAKPKPEKITTAQFMTALGKELSGGNYNSRNSNTGEFGKYQILPGNWSAWASQYLGDANAAPTPDNQEKVAKAKIADLYAKYGSWQAVAHWWATGGIGADADQGDPSKWGKLDSQFVTNVIRGAGGVVTSTTPAGGASTNLPTTPGKPYVTPTTAVTTAAGKGVTSGLRAIVPGTRSKDPKSGLTTQETVGIDFPKNLDGDYFDQLYDEIHKALDNGETSHVYRDSQGHEVNILLPDNPMGRAALTNGLDTSAIQLARERAVVAAGTDREGVETENYNKVVARAGTNQIKLLDSEYGGKYPKGSDMASLRAGVTSPAMARGLGANPSVTSAQINKMTNANARNEAQTEHYTGLQANSLTPIASGQRVLDYTKNYIETETALAQQAWDNGRPTDAYTHLRNIDIATDDTSTLYRQIAIYDAQGRGAVKAIAGASGADVPAKVATELAALHAFDADLEAARAKKDKLWAEMKPFLKTTADGQVVFNAPSSTGITLKMGDDTIWNVDQKADGSLGYTAAHQKGAGYGNTDAPNVPQSDDPERVLTRVGGPRAEVGSAYAKWHKGVIGYVKTDKSELLPVMGRVLDIKSPDGQFIVEDPFQQGRWAPGPIYWTAPKDSHLRLEPTTKADGSEDGTGRTAITWDDGKGTTYKFTYNEKTGVSDLYSLAPPDIAKNRQVTPLGSANLPKNRDDIKATGFGLSAGDNRPDTLSFLLMPNVNGPWVTSVADAVETIYGDRARTFGQQLANQIGRVAADVFGGGAATGTGRVRGGSWTPNEPFGSPMPSARPPSRVGMPWDFINPPGVNAAGVPSSPRSIGSPPPVLQRNQAPASGYAASYVSPLGPTQLGAGAGAVAAPSASMGVGVYPSGGGGGGNVQATGTLPPIARMGTPAAPAMAPGVAARMGTPAVKPIAKPPSPHTQVAAGSGNVQAVGVIPAKKPVPSRLAQKPA